MEPMLWSNQGLWLSHRANEQPGESSSHCCPSRFPEDNLKPSYHGHWSHPSVPYLHSYGTAPGMGTPPLPGQQCQYLTALLEKFFLTSNLNLEEKSWPGWLHTQKSAFKPFKLLQQYMHGCIPSKNKDASMPPITQHRRESSKARMPVSQEGVKRLCRQHSSLHSSSASSFRRKDKRLLFPLSPWARDN